MMEREERQELENLMVVALIKGLGELFDGDMEMTQRTMSIFNLELLNFNVHEVVQRLAVDLFKNKFAQSKN